MIPDLPPNQFNRISTTPAVKPPEALIKTRFDFTDTTKRAVKLTATHPNGHVEEIARWNCADTLNVLGLDIINRKP